jgi:hypothetical protein
MRRLLSFPPAKASILLVLLLSIDNRYTTELYDFLSLIEIIGKYQEHSKHFSFWSVPNAIAKRVSASHRGQFLALRPSFEKMLAGFKFPSTTNEIPHLCSLLNSLTQDEVTTFLTEFQSSHCH